MCKAGQNVGNGAGYKEYCVSSINFNISNNKHPGLKSTANLYVEHQKSVTLGSVLRSKIQ